MAMALFISLLIGLALLRVWAGPTIYDRLLGVGIVGTNAVLLLAIIGFIYGRPDGFLDLAITYAILNFVGVVAVAKFLDVRRASRGEDHQTATGAGEDG
ncbi:MAG: pH regulation protein F [Gemmatimonadales bacterium]|nr:MAG: pH regulation protein F [Gemmatimonadales bacterium]